MAKPSFENIEINVEDEIATINVNRPKALNALNEATIAELATVFRYLQDNAPGMHGEELIRTVIFTGSGKSFIAGADIVEMKDKDPKAGELFAQAGQNVTRQMELLPQPIIAAVNGFALGGGCEFAMACDFIIASDRALFGQPEVGLGIIPGFGGCVRLAKYVGLSRARELIYTGRKIKADEAKELGLVLEVVEGEKLLDRAKEIAQSMAKVSPLAVARAKKAMNQMYHLSFDDALKDEALTFASIFGSHDQREGMGAFSEKRTANFKGE